MCFASEASKPSAGARIYRAWRARNSSIVIIDTISQVPLLAVFSLLTVVAVKGVRAVLDFKTVVTALALWPS